MTPYSKTKPLTIFLSTPNSALFYEGVILLTHKMPEISATMSVQNNNVCWLWKNENSGCMQIVRSLVPSPFKLSETIPPVVTSVTSVTLVTSVTSVTLSHQ